MRPGPNGRKIRGSRYGKGKRWQARWVEDHGGHSIEKARAFASKDAALAHLARIAVHGPDLPRPRITVGAYADTWRKSQLHHRAHTQAALNTIFTRMIQPELGRLPVAGTTRVDVQNAVTQWASHYSPTTVSQAYSYTRTLFASAVVDRIISESPCVRISLPPRDKKRLVPLTPDQVKTITAAMPEHLRAAVILAAATGLRIGEIGGLAPEHVESGVVSVIRQLHETRASQPVFGPPKTKGSVRDVSMGAVATAAVQQHMEDHTTRSGLVFGTVWGYPLDRRRASAAWRDATKGLALPPDTGWHALRHFHASALISAGLSPRAVADRLGHSTVTQTLSTYSHLWGTDDEKSVAAIDAIIGD